MQGEASTRLGFTDYFRVELAWAKLLGAVLLLAPVPARLKEWAYAAIAITLGSALIAHLSIGEGPRGWLACAHEGSHDPAIDSLTSSIALARDDAPTLSNQTVSK